MPARGAGGARHPLELQAIDHVHVAAVAIFAFEPGVERAVARVQYDRAYLNSLVRSSMSSVDRAGWADIHHLPQRVQRSMSITGALGTPRVGGR